MIRIGFPAALLATPAAAASGPFFTLANTDFVVLIAFVLFVGVLFYFRVPRRIAGILDARAASIRADLDEARALREEAQTLLASFERKHREAKAQVERIIATARNDAELAAEKGKDDIGRAVERRMRAAEEQIEQARDAAMREVRDRAVEVAIAAATRVIRERMSEDRAASLIDRSIDTVGAKLH